MYTIDVDRPHGLITVTLHGMMSLEEAVRYIADLKRALVTNGMVGYAMLIDVTHCPIQSQETVQAMGGHIASMPKARRLAIVTGSSLARMQVRRLFTQPYARIVPTLEQARAWAIDGTEPQPDHAAA